MRRGQNTIVARCASDATVLLSQYLTKVGNPKVASPKMRRVSEQRLAVRVSACPRSGPLRLKSGRDGIGRWEVAQSHRKPALRPLGPPSSHPASISAPGACGQRCEALPSSGRVHARHRRRARRAPPGARRLRRYETVAGSWRRGARARVWRLEVRLRGATYQSQEVVHSVPTRIDWVAKRQRHRHETHCP